ncbi:hypothetical protein NLG97_g1281 [Lecanicillium saksenae]|uniref:Uncharacterized protein n=1 Tax=Lecanicillium saksenae TaxID=468837 RepID=A0ACC1R5G8_9HYPO|nr:hypothetical protein NLG97_g1281 [Lecanicillium saksenae]
MVEVFKLLAAIQKETLGETHPTQLASQHELADAYQANSQVKEAIKILKHVVAIQKETLAETHPSRLASQHKLARAYQANGQVTKAIEVLEYVVEAIEVLEHVVAIQKETLAETHPDRLASQHVLAGAYQANGQVTEAIEVLEHVVAIRKESLAETHPSRLASQHLETTTQNTNYEILFTRSYITLIQSYTKHAVDKLAGQQLSWWPLSQPEEILRDGYTRGGYFYDDIPTAFAELLFPKLALYRPQSGMAWSAMKRKAILLHDTTLMRLLLNSFSASSTIPTPGSTEAAGQEAGEAEQEAEGRAAFDLSRKGTYIQSKETETPTDTVDEEHNLIHGPALFVSIDIGLNESRARCVNPGNCDKETLYNIRKMYRKMSPTLYGRRNPTGIKFYRVLHPKPRRSDTILFY